MRTCFTFAAAVNLFGWCVLEGGCSHVIHSCRRGGGLRSWSSLRCPCAPSPVRTWEKAPVAANYRYRGSGNPPPPKKPANWMSVCLPVRLISYYLFISGFVKMASTEDVWVSCMSVPRCCGSGSSLSRPLSLIPLLCVFGTLLVALRREVCADCFVAHYATVLGQGRWSSADNI